MHPDGTPAHSERRMRAAVITAVGEPPTPGSAPAPVRGPGEVLVAVSVATLNPVEVHVWRGVYRDGPPQTPYVPGTEGVGHVIAGEQFEPGTRVWFEVVGLHPGYGTNGAIAEQALAPLEVVVPLPDDIDDGTAAALGGVGITALRVLETAGEVRDRTVLVLGATGQIGLAAVQIAKAKGAAHVVAAGRDSSKLDTAAQRGADATVQLAGGVSEMAEALRAAAPGGFNIVVDPLWGEPAEAALQASAVDVVHVNFGRTAGDPLSLSHPLLLRKRATVRGLSTAMDRHDQRSAAYGELLGYVRDGRLVIDRELVEFEDVAVAWSRLVDGPDCRLVVVAPLPQNG